MHVSAARIVKHEAKTLGRCLQGIRCHDDLIALVDTGSSAATRDIALHVVRQQEALPWTHRAPQMCLGETWHRANWDFFHT